MAAAEDVVVADILASACKALNAGCFAAGTKLLTRRGWVAVEEIGVGDEVASRSELDPRGAVEWKGVEATFRRTGRILHLHFPGGELVRTTPEHPFWVEGTGWTPAGALGAGDRVATLSGEWVAVAEAYDTGQWEPVYNLRVADHHTYFVGDDGWGFAAWAHNEYTAEVNRIIREVVSGRGVAAGSGFSHEAGRTGGRANWASLSYLKEHLRAMISKYYPSLSPSEAETVADCAGTRILRLAGRTLPQSWSFIPQYVETYRPTSAVVPAEMSAKAHNRYALSNARLGITSVTPISANLNQGGWDVALATALGRVDVGLLA